MRGVSGLKIQNSAGNENVIQFVIDEAKKMKMIKSGAKIAVLHATSEGNPDESNIMKVIDIE